MPLETLSAGLFAREEWRVASPVTVTADFAWRHQRYSMRDDRFDGVREIEASVLSEAIAAREKLDADAVHLRPVRFDGGDDDVHFGEGPLDAVPGPGGGPDLGGEGDVTADASVEADPGALLLDVDGAAPW